LQKRCDEGCRRGWMNASKGTNSSAKDGACRHVCLSSDDSGGCIPGMSPSWLSAKARGARSKEPDDLVLHLVERECVAVINVGEKLFVRLLVAGGFTEVEAHESDEGIDVWDRHGLHVA